MSHFFKLEDNYLTTLSIFLKIHSSVDGHLDCFPGLAIVNNAAMNMGADISLRFRFHLFWIYAPKSENSSHDRENQLVCLVATHPLLTSKPSYSSHICTILSSNSPVSLTTYSVPFDHLFAISSWVFVPISHYETYHFFSSGQFSRSVVSDSATPRTAARQASLSIANSRSLLKLMSIVSMMPSNHLILCHLLLLPPSIFPNIRVFSNESVLHIRWPKYWSFSEYSSEYSGIVSTNFL